MNRRCRHRGGRPEITQTPDSDCKVLDKGGFDWRSGHCPLAGFQAKNAEFAAAGSSLSPW